MVSDPPLPVYDTSQKLHSLEPGGSVKAKVWGFIYLGIGQL